MIYIEKLKKKRCHCGVIMTGQTLTGVGAKDFEELRPLSVDGCSKLSTEFLIFHADITTEDIVWEGIREGIRKYIHQNLALYVEVRVYYNCIHSLVG